MKSKLARLDENLNGNEYSSSEYLDELKTCFNAYDRSKSAYAVKTFDNDIGKLRIADHNAVIKDRQGQKTKTTSIVIQLEKSRGRRKNARIAEFVYSPETLDKEKQKDILNGIKDWIETENFTGSKFTLKKSLAEIELIPQSQEKPIKKSLYSQVCEILDKERSAI